MVGTRILLLGVAKADDKQILLGAKGWFFKTYYILECTPKDVVGHPNIVL